jgi:Ca2+-transporting ATPase
MTVVQTYLGSLPSRAIDAKPGHLKDIAKPYIEVLSEAIAINSTAEMVAMEDGTREFVGSKTEVALLNFYKQQLVPLGVAEHHDVRTQCVVANQIPFDSARKRMATTIKHKNTTRLHVKGASEIILDLCDKKIDVDGKIKALDKKELNETIVAMAEKSLRTIGVAYRDAANQPDEDGEQGGMVLVGIFGIKDPLRIEVKEAVRQCKTVLYPSLRTFVLQLILPDCIISAVFFFFFSPVLLLISCRPVLQFGWLQVTIL